MALGKKKDLQLHFNVLTTPSSILKACTREDESGRTGMQPYKRTARRIIERLAKTFFLSYHTEKIKGEIDERLYKETSCQRQTGMKTERQANRQCSSLLW